MICRAAMPASLFEDRQAVFAVHLAARLLQERHPIAGGAADAGRVAVIRHEAVAARARQFLRGAL